MIRTYLEFARKSFRTNVVYRADYFAGIINTILMIFINISIWKAIYEEEESVGGVQFKMLITYIVFSFFLQCIFTMDEYIIQNKVQTGLISSDFLKPINFRVYLLSYHLGGAAFRIIMQFVPALIISIFAFGLLPPFSVAMAVYFTLSVILAYLVLYNLNFIVWVSSFWFYWTFSLITIKEAAIMVFSGALIPLWFMPQWLVDIIQLTPFDSIYYIPISIYLGQVPANEIAFAIIKQFVWVLILFGIGQLLWKTATKKLVVQGG
ncbi:MAG TPA: ABC-2 family transporter protein [Ruminiclostridium sp.]|nr:ABC-2 family transporter protein [Ruminiclostridium sp.]